VIIICEEYRMNVDEKLDPKAFLLKGLPCQDYECPYPLDRDKLVVNDYQGDKRQLKRAIAFRWIIAFFSLVVVPNCQSMPSQNPPSNTIVINQIGGQNIQTVNITYNIQTQNK